MKAACEFHSSSIGVSEKMNLVEAQRNNSVASTLGSTYEDAAGAAENAARNDETNKAEHYDEYDDKNNTEHEEER
jgi:hypothetical protein